MAGDGFYTAAEAAKIASVPRSTLDYWTRTGLVPASQRSARPRLFSFADLRDIVVVEKLRGQGAKTRAIRSALDWVRSVADVKRLAHASFGVDAGGLVMPFEGQLVAPHAKGQYVLAMSDVYRQLGADPEEPTVLRPVPGILIDPRVRGGAPVIEGTRIPAQLVVEYLQDGLSNEELLSLYPSLPPSAIHAALEWDRVTRGQAA